MRCLTFAQGQTEIPVSAIIHPPLPPTNLYFLSISRILEVKQGPFFEHSSQLYSIATGVQHWSKVNSGLFKMYDVSSCNSSYSCETKRFSQAEVLGKRVVVQHIPLGGLLAWDPSPARAVGQPAHASPQSVPLSSGTKAPWAMSNTATAPLSAALLGSLPAAAAPWAGSPAASSHQTSAGHSYTHSRPPNSQS